MDYVPSMAAVTAAAQKPQPVEAVAPTPKEAITVAPPALDPRSIYTLTPEAAGAVFALVETRIQAADAAAFDPPDRRGAQVVTALATAAAATPVVSPETTKTMAAANRNWTEDVRLEHSASRMVGTDTIVQYDNPRVMAAWSAAFPDIAGRKFRGLLLADTHLRSALRQAQIDTGLGGSEKNIYLLCNSEHFEAIRHEHPGTHINWINVDNDEIVLFWPKHSDDE
ncbi:hypothetical protein ACRBEV_12935 [Methylobacterium phyllosphaerae]